MKSKAQILIEEINKICEERGLQKPKEVKKEGSFTHIPSKKDFCRILSNFKHI